MRGTIPETPPNPPLESNIAVSPPFGRNFAIDTSMTQIVIRQKSPHRGDGSINIRIG